MLVDTATDHVTWPLFLAGISLTLGLIAVVWGWANGHAKEAERKLEAERAKRAEDLAQIWQTLKADKDASHAFQLEVAQHYTRTDQLRTALDSALEPIKVELRHLTDFARQTRDEVHERRGQQT